MVVHFPGVFLRWRSVWPRLVAHHIGRLVDYAASVRFGAEHINGVVLIRAQCFRNCFWTDGHLTVVGILTFVVNSMLHDSPSSYVTVSTDAATPSCCETPVAFLDFGSLAAEQRDFARHAPTRSG